MCAMSFTAKHCALCLVMHHPVCTNTYCSVLILIFSSLHHFIFLLSPFYFPPFTILFSSLHHFIFLPSPFYFPPFTILFFSLHHFIFLPSPFYFPPFAILFLFYHISSRCSIEQRGKSKF